jgi:hypothetical protein
VSFLERFRRAGFGGEETFGRADGGVGDPRRTIAIWGAERRRPSLAQTAATLFLAAQD